MDLAETCFVLALRRLSLKPIRRVLDPQVLEPTLALLRSLIRRVRRVLEPTMLVVALLRLLLPCF